MLGYSGANYRAIMARSFFYRIYPKYWDSITTYILLVKFENSFYYLLICLIYCWMSDNVHSKEMPHSMAPDLGLHCLHMPVCPNI